MTAEYSFPSVLARYRYLAVAAYVALVVAYPRGSNCANSDLWLATTPDGIHWRSYAMPLMWRSMAAAKQRAISTWYRGTLRDDAATDSLDIWPSAMSGMSWSVYHATVKLSGVIGLLAAAQPGEFKPSLNRSINAVFMPMP